MKITIEAEDLPALETTLMRAIVRAVRLLAKEGTLHGLAETASPSPELEQVAPRPVQQPVSPSAPYRPSWARPFDPSAEKVRSPEDLSQRESLRRADLPVAPRPEARSTPAAPEPTETPRRTRRTMSQICKTVKDRPNGFVPTDEVYNLIDTKLPVQTLNTWIIKGEVPALIVTSYRPPSKGLPGRLMVEKAAVIKREALRKHNVELSPSRRTAVPRTDQRYQG